jgi:hypothetical protein
VNVVGPYWLSPSSSLLVPRVDETGSVSPSKDSPSCRSYLDVTIQIRSSPVVCLSFGVCSECRRTVLVESFLCAVGPR